MAVISFANAKGGSGKTTSALILATELARRNATVCLIDADPLRWITRWSEIKSVLNLTVISDTTEKTIAETISTASENYAFVLIDLEGTTNVSAAISVAMSDLVICPLQGSSLDGEAAGETISMVNSQSLVRGKEIALTALFTRTSAAILTRSHKAIRAQLIEAGIDILSVSLVERAAYRELFAFGGGITNLDPKEVNGIPKAQVNAELYADIVIEKLKG